MAQTSFIAVAVGAAKSALYVAPNALHEEDRFRLLRQALNADLVLFGHAPVC